MLKKRNTVQRSLKLLVFASLPQGIIMSNTRSRLVLLKELGTIEDMNLTVLSTGKLTWPYNNKILICWISVLSGAFLKITAALSVASNCPQIIIVIFTINSKIMIKGKLCTLCNAETKWPYFQKLLKTTFGNFILLKTDDDITRAIESFNYAVQQTVWNAAWNIKQTKY
jgi:hypothetical protein